MSNRCFCSDAAGQLSSMLHPQIGLVFRRKVHLFSGGKMALAFARLGIGGN
jgi:hypothetical protein